MWKHFQNGVHVNKVEGFHIKHLDYNSQTIARFFVFVHYFEMSDQVSSESLYPLASSVGGNVVALRVTYQYVEVTSKEIPNYHSTSSEKTRN